MADNWKPYLCNVNEKLASIFINLGLGSVAPIASTPWLLWVWVYFQMPRPDGLSDSTEAPTLYKIEDELNLSLAQSCQAMPCGRITTQGRREFYFYGETNKGLRLAAEVALRKFQGYRFDTGNQSDPQWNHYFDVLYPSDEDLQRIANMDLLDVLKERGDVVTVPRDVRHWIYFPSKDSRALFRDAAVAIGFKIVSESKFDGELPFGIVIVRAESIEKSSIDKTVVDLLQLAQHFQGEYDGWETQVITQ